MVVWFIPAGIIAGALALIGGAHFFTGIQRLLGDWTRNDARGRVQPRCRKRKTAKGCLPLCGSALKRRDAWGFPAPLDLVARGDCSVSK